MTFLPNERYLHDGMFANESAALETLHNWIELSAGESPLSYSELPAWGGWIWTNEGVDGRGYVKIEDADKYGLGKGYEMSVNSTHTEPAYMLSVFHQLHCLVCPLLTPPS